MDNLAKMVAAISNLADAFRKKYNTTDKLGFDDMIKLLEKASLMILPQKSLVITTDPSGSNVIETIGSDIWVFISETLMTHTDEALQMAKNSACHLHIHLVTKAVGSNYNNISGNVKLDTSAQQVAFNIKVGDAIDVDLALVNINGADDLRVAIHNLSGFWQWDPSSSYVEILADS